MSTPVRFVSGMAVVAFVALSCTSESGHRGPAPSAVELSAAARTQGALLESADAARRTTELRARFGLGAAVATHFVAGRVAGRVEARLPAAAHARVARTARVELPERATDEATLTDERSRVSLSFALERAKPVRVELAGGLAVYRDALDGADVVHRVTAEGTEDYVIFASRPEKEELRYRVDVGDAAGLRLVGGTLELLAADGAPVLRVAPPYVVDAEGQRHDATLAVDGCAYDTTPAGPWGRPVTRPGARYCSVRVAWASVSYPAMVDPVWIATGSMGGARSNHTATTLASGKVLVVGGSAAKTAELFDPIGETWATTGAMSVTRYYLHTSTLLDSGRVLVAGGAVSTVTLPSLTAVAEVYDPGTGLFNLTGALGIARSGHGATTLLSGKVLIVGGSTSQQSELFDPAANAGVGAFATGPLTTVVRNVSQVTATRLLGGKVLVTGGSYATAELFDPAANGGAGGFVATGSMTIYRTGHTTTLLPSNKVLIAGGFCIACNQGYGMYVNTAELFDPAANGGIGAFAATGSMLVGGGAAGRSEHAATLLPSGKVVLSGGAYRQIFPPPPPPPGSPPGPPNYLPFVYPKSTNIYDPALGTFVTVADMTVARTNHTLSALSTGKVLAVGGGDASAELGDTRGAACATTSYCFGSFCSDGVCCDSACDSGSCDRCNLPASLGKCALAPEGDPGASPACTLPYACDGVSTTCPSACTSDAQCASGSYCAPDGTCQPRKAQGSACSAQADCKLAGCRVCQTGFCVDGVCCDTACTGLCQTCKSANKQDASADGTCGAASNHLDPHNDCSPSGGPCGPDGACDGAGGCRLHAAAGVSCGAGQCQGAIAKGELCDGAGACITNGPTVDCAPFACKGGGCTMSCQTTADCAVNGYCSGGGCSKRRALGNACAADEQCLSAHCADGVCCTAACDGQCEACDVAGSEGTCAIITGAPHKARPKCTQAKPDKPCTATVCDGIERTSCSAYVGPEVSCGAASCADGTATTTGACNGKGACNAAPPMSCGAYACDVSACKAQCESDRDCAAGFACDVAEHTCAAAATCDGDHTTTGANGKTLDCAPYKCTSTGNCRADCDTVADCVAPTVCDASKKCVLLADAPPESGCAMVAHRPTRSGLGAAIVAALCALAARRRRARQTLQAR